MQDTKQIKIVLLGDSGVGKTCIVKRFNNLDFNEFEQATAGQQFSQKQVTLKDKKYQLNIHDTAGQEQYRSLASLYYKNAQIAIIVYSITSSESFNSVVTWIDELKQKGPENITIAIVGNKIDMIEDEQVNYSTAQDYANKIEAHHFQTSAKQNAGIENLFHEIVQRYIEKEQIRQEKSQKPKPNPREQPETNNTNQPVKLQNPGHEPKPGKKKDGGCC